MKYAIKTFGCKVNQYESAAIDSIMRNSGWEKAEDSASEYADVVIVNSCTVTGSGDKKALNLLTELKRNNPEVITVLAGCVPQAYPDVAKESAADIIIGTSGRNKLPELIEEYLEKRERTVSVLSLPTVYEELAVGSDDAHTRAFIKIEDGCDSFCSYCAIPYARGRVRSRDLADIAAEAELRARNGCREAVLIGINLSCYGKDCGLTLADAVEAVTRVNGIERVRLSSLEPELLTETVIRRFSECGKLCPHFHLSLQSGSDTVLRRMNRHYTAEEYLGIVQSIRRYFPSASITTDIIVGFPGETEEEFAETLGFAERIGFAKIHSFSYSPREGTSAARMTDGVPASVKKRRHAELCALDDKLSREHLNRLIGTEQSVLIERRQSELYIGGHAADYTLVRLPGADFPRGSLVRVNITGAGDGFVIGEAVK